MSSRAAVAPPGSPPVFGWCSSGRGLGPPVGCRPCLWEAGADLPLIHREPTRAASVLTFPTSLGCLRKLGELCPCSGSEWARAPGWGEGRFWVGFAQVCSWPEGNGGVGGRRGEKQRVGVKAQVSTQDQCQGPQPLHPHSYLSPLPFT